MATTRERAQAAREAKLDELHKRLTGAVEHLVSGEGALPPDLGHGG